MKFSGNMLMSYIVSCEHIIDTQYIFIYHTIHLYVNAHVCFK